MKLNRYADPSSEKRQAYDAAKALLDRHDSDSLRYVALELRRCMEAIVYEKLKIYGDLLPEGSVHQWKPPQAFDALIAIEPNAETTLTYAIARETKPGTMATGPFKTIGVDQRPKAKWVKKRWQKLGFYLHADWPFAIEKPKVSPRPFMERTLAELEPMANNSFSATMSPNINFPCAGCGATVKVMEKAVENGCEVVCLSCGVPHEAKNTEDGLAFIPGEPPFTCDECGAATYVPFKDVRVGYKFSCRNCNRAFQVFGVDWKFGVADAADSQDAEAEEDMT